MQHLSTVFEILSQQQLYLKRSKCRFVQVRIQYFGHITSQNGVAMDKEKVEAVTNWSRP